MHQQRPAREASNGGDGGVAAGVADWLRWRRALMAVSSCSLLTVSSTLLTVSSALLAVSSGLLAVLLRWWSLRVPTASVLPTTSTVLRVRVVEGALARLAVDERPAVVAAVPLCDPGWGYLGRTSSTAATAAVGLWLRGYCCWPYWPWPRPGPWPYMVACG